MTPEALSKEFDETLHEAISPKIMEEKLKEGIPIIVVENGKNYAIMPSSEPFSEEELRKSITNSTSHKWVIARMRFFEKNILPKIANMMQGEIKKRIESMEEYHLQLCSMIYCLGESLTKLDSPLDFQTVALITRSAFEIAVEVAFTKNPTPAEIKKILTWLEAKKNGYIKTRKDTNDHWSGKSFPQRVNKTNLAKAYQLYPVFSWYSHGSLIGFSGVENPTKLYNTYIWFFLSFFKEIIDKTLGEEVFINYNNWLKTNPKVELR